MVMNGIDVRPEHVQGLHQYHSLPVQEVLPSFYWLPKLQKTPYGTGFIAVSKKCIYIYIYICIYYERVIIITYILLQDHTNSL